jgi:hypothetical protein
MQERAEESRLKLWLLMEADRWWLAAGLSGVVLAGLLFIELVEPSTVEATLRRQDPVETLFQAMATGIITGVTLVVSINQLVLSQELGPVGDQRDRMGGSLNYRTDAERHLDQRVSPSNPSAFLRALLEAVADDGHALSADSTAPADLSEYADAVAADANAVADRFADVEFGTFNMLGAALDFNYSAKISEGRHLRMVHGETLSDGQSERLDDILDVLQLYGSGREHFKTLYFQWELINLSRGVLYAAVPSLTIAAGMILFFHNPAFLPGRTLGVPNALWVVNLAFLVTISPFMLLVSYILRIVTVAKHTLAIGPFVLRDTDDETLGRE